MIEDSVIVKVNRVLLTYQIIKMKAIKYRYFLVLFFILFVIIGGCNKSNLGISSLYTPAISDVTATATLLELQQGRAFYINNCNSCHALYSPDDYTVTQWKNIISSMGPKTGMSAPEILLVTKYLTKGK